MYMDVRKDVGYVVAVVHRSFAEVCPDVNSERMEAS